MGVATRAGPRKSETEVRRVCVESGRDGGSSCRAYLSPVEDNGETDIENRNIDMGRREERVRCRETTWKLTLPFVK